MTNLSITFHLPGVIKPKGDIFVANCPVLDLFTQGDTENEAKKNLKEAIELFLITCFENGTLQSVLTESGFRAGTVNLLDDDSNKTNNYIPINAKVPLYITRSANKQCLV